MTTTPSIPTLPTLFESIREAYPLTGQAFSAMPNGGDWLARLVELDSHWRRMIDPPSPMVTFAPPENIDGEAFDVIVAGGCLGLIVASVLATVHGRKVLVLDRHVVGKTHRDWNISRAELRQFVETGLFSHEEMETFIVNEYAGGFVKFFDRECPIKAGKIWFDDVLNVAVESDRLLAACRQKLEASETGSRCLDGATLKQVFSTDNAAWIEVENVAGGRARFRTSLVIDVMGTLSPIARQLNPEKTISYVCPTVGTLATGFVEGDAEDEVDLKIGEILVSTGHIDEGRQLLWEGFPGHAAKGEYTSYLFFYSQVDSDVDKSLLKLFEEYFRRLPEYKRPGENWRTIKPVFGYIPGFHHTGWGQQKKTATNRILLIGDAASLNSTLTFCGFGSLVRNLRRLTHLVDQALTENRLDDVSLGKISAYEPRVAVMATFARFMMAESVTSGDKQAINSLLNVVMEALARLPESARRGMFQDRMEWSDFVRMLMTMQAIYPAIWDVVPNRLGLERGLLWLLNFAEYTAHSFQSEFFNRFGEMLGSLEPPGVTEFDRLLMRYRFQTT